MFDLSSLPEAPKPAEPLDLFDGADLPDLSPPSNLNTPEAPTPNLVPTPEANAATPEDAPPGESSHTLERPPFSNTETAPLAPVSPEEPEMPPENLLETLGTDDTTPHIEEIAFDSTRDESEIQKIVSDTLGKDEIDEALQTTLVRVLMKVSLTIQPAELLQQLQKATESFSQTPEDRFFLEAVYARLVQEFHRTYQRS